MKVPLEAEERVTFSFFFLLTILDGILLLYTRSRALGLTSDEWLWGPALGSSNY